MDAVAKIPAALKVLEKGKYDELVENLIQNAVRTSKEGIVNFTIDKTKPGKLEQALALARRYWLQYSSVPGFEFEITVWATAEEAFGAIDMKPPPTPA